MVKQLGNDFSKKLAYTNKIIANAQNIIPVISDGKASYFELVRSPFINAPDKLLPMINKVRKNKI